VKNSNEQETHYAISINRNGQPGGVLCPSKLLFSKFLLCANDVLRADWLLHFCRLLYSSGLLQAATVVGPMR